jgi:hypothetical protein
MKRRRRHIVRNGLLALSALSVLAAVVMDVRSYRKLDELSRVNGLGVTESIVSFRGGVHLARSGNRGADRGWTWDAYTIEPDTDWEVVYLTGTLKFRALGFGWLQDKLFNSARPFGNVKSRLLVPWLNASPYDAVIVPYWFIALLLAAPWWGRWIVRGIARLRPRPGTCKRCGYDLRATPDRCPECGLVPGSKRKPHSTPSGVVA